MSGSRQNMLLQAAAAAAADSDSSNGNSPRTTETLKQSGAMNKVMGILGGSTSSGSGAVLGHILTTSLAPVDEGGRQWRITTRKVADRRKPNVTAQPVLSEHPWRRHSVDLYDALSHLHILHFFRELPREVATELLRWAVMKSYDAGDIVASPRPEDADQMLQVIVSGSATAMIYPASPKGKLEKNTPTFTSLATILSKKEGEGNDSSETQDKGSVRFMLEGACLGEMHALATCVSHKEEVVALEPLVVLCVSHRYFIHAFQFVVASGEEGVCGIAQWLRQINCDKAPKASGDMGVEGGQKASDGKQASAAANAKKSARLIAPQKTWKRMGKAVHDYQQLAESEIHVEEEAHHLDTLRCPARESKSEKIMAQRCSEHKQKLKKLLSTSPVMRNAIDVADITTALRNLAWPFAHPEGGDSKKQQPMLTSVSRRAILQHFKHGDVIYKEGESADFTYLLLDGEVRLSRSSELRLPEDDSSVFAEPEELSRPSPKSFLRMRSKGIKERQATASSSPRVSIAASTPNWKKVKAVNTALGALGINRRRLTVPMELPSAASLKSGPKTPNNKMRVKVARHASVYVPSPNGERAKLSQTEEKQYAPSPRHGAAKLRETLKRSEFHAIVSNRQEKETRRNRKLRKGMSFRVTDEEQQKEKVPQAAFALSDMMATLKKLEAEEAEKEARRQEKLRREEEEREEAEQQSGLGAVIGPGGYRQVCLLGEEALVPPSLANERRSEQHMLYRASTVSAKTDCTVVILDTLGWVEEGGLDATLAAPCAPSLNPLESFFLRYVALEAQSTGACTAEALKAANELEVASGKKRNPWVEAWDDPEGREVPVSAVRKMCRGLPNVHAVRAIEKLPGMLQTLSGPFRETLIPRMKYMTFVAGTPIDEMVVEADGQPPELVAFVLRGTLQLDVFEDEHEGGNASGNWNVLKNRSRRLSKKALGITDGTESSEEQMKITETYHRTAWINAGSMLDSWALREEHKVARLMALSQDETILPLVAEVHCSTDCELLLFSHQGYSLAKHLSGPMLGLRPEKARRARAVLYTPPAQRTSPQVALLGEVLQQAPLLRAMRPTAVISIAMGLTHRISVKASHALQDITETNATEPHDLVAKLADDSLNGKAFKPKKTADAPRRRVSADGAEDDGNGMRGYALAVVLSGAVQEIRSQHRRAEADDGGFCVRPGYQTSSSAKESLGNKGPEIETTSISISHGPSKVICDVRSVVMDLEPRRINAWAEMFTELALLRKYDYKAVKAVKEDHKDFLKKHINFITSTSDAFEDLDEEELLEIIPFLEFKTFPKGTMVARKGQKLSYLYINYKGTTTTRHNFGGVIMEVATHGKTTILGRASVFLDSPEEYDEVATSSNVELLAVPKNIILGTSSKFIHDMTKGAEDEQKFFARQVEKKLGLMELLGTQHLAASGLVQRSAGSNPAMQQLQQAFLDATCDDGIGKIVEKLKESEAAVDESPTSEKDQDMEDVPNPTWSDEPEVAQPSVDTPANLKSSLQPKERLSAGKRPVSAAQSQGRAWRRSDSGSSESPQEGRSHKPRGTIVGGRHLLSSSMPSLPPDAALQRKSGSSDPVMRHSATQLSARSRPAISRLSSSRAGSLCPSGPAMVANAVFAAREQVDEEIRLRHRGLNPYTLPKHRTSVESAMSAILRPGASHSSSGRLLSKANKIHLEEHKPVNHSVNSSRGSGVMPAQNLVGGHAHPQLAWEASRKKSGEWLDGPQSQRPHSAQQSGSASDTAGRIRFSTQQGELPIYGSLAAKLGKTGQRSMDCSSFSRTSMTRTPPPQFAVTPSAEAASPERIIADVFHRKKAAETAARPFSAVTPRNSLPMHDRPSKGRRRSSTDAGSAPLRNGSQQMSFIAANVYSIDRDALSPAGGTSAQRRAFDGENRSRISTRRGSSSNAPGGVQGLRTH